MNKIEKLHLAYFSPSGSTEKIVKTVASAIEGLPVETHDLLTSASRKKEYNFGRDELVIFGCMTAGKLFTLSDEIFACLHGDGTPFIGIATFGNTYYGIALKEARERATNSGFSVVALGAFVARHSIDPTFGADRPDAKDNELMKDFGRRAYEKVLSGDLTLHTQPKTGWSALEMGNKVVAYREEHPDEPYALPPSYKSKEISNACIKCGRCVRSCPVDAIDINNKTFDLDRCIGCWGCINRCPMHAIKSTSKEMADIMKMISDMPETRLEPEIFF
ncbi:MAG: 4Fe-4S binding protein [Synergistaceae bacterium]|nr:4Fe-4S binding protein [Synergistaceae bacterium]